MKYVLNFDNHSDFNIMEKNRLAPRAYCIPDTTEKKKAAADYKNERYESGMVTVLSGEWDFKYYKSKAAMPATADTDKLKFDTVLVPSTWQRTGYEPPVYLNCPYGFTGTGVVPPTLPADFSAGLYRKKFIVGDTAKTRYITFLGIAPCLDLYINGTFIGYGEGAHNSYEFDITPFLHEGENELVAVLFKWCTGSYLEAQDMFRENGIFRDVYITEYPATFLNDFEVKTQKTGKKYALSAALFLKGALEGVKAQMTLLDGKKKLAAAEADAAETLTLHFVSLPVTEWNAEEPKLYELRITLKKGGKELMCVRSFTGFRTIKIEDNVFTFNGKKIKLKGVNHHDTHETKGYALSVNDMERDVLLMKEYNVNCVRTSHYPPDPQFLAFCDKYGLYVVDEADIETHGLPALGLHIDDISMDLKWAARYVDRVKRMYYRDRSRPCILMWSLGNESGGYKCHDKCYAFLHDACPEIPVHYEGVTRTKRHHYDVHSEMYTHPYDVEKVGKGTRGAVYKTVPFYLCEYCHAMGVGPGAMEEYWDILFAYDNLMGGCVWEWADHSVKHPKDDKKYSFEYTYGGDHGEKYHDGCFCVDGLFYPDRSPHTGAEEMKVVYRPVRASHAAGNTFVFVNTNRFKNASYLEICWLLKKDGIPAKTGSMTLDIAPQKTRKVTLPLDRLEKGHNYHIDFCYLEKGAVRAVEQLVLAEAPISFDVPAPGKVAVEKDKKTVSIRFADGSAVFNAKSGFLTGYTIGGKALLSDAQSLVPNIFRAPTDNDRNIEKLWVETFGIDNCQWKLNTFEVKSTEGTAAVEADYVCVGKEGPLFDVSMRYTVGENGVIAVCASLSENDGYDDCLYDIPRFGVYFAMPENYENAAYFGRGPLENLPDFKAQSPVGVYAAKVSDMHENYIRPQDNGNHIDTRYLKLTDKKGAGLMVCSDGKFTFNVHPYSQKLLTEAKHREDIVNEGATFVTVDGFTRGTGTNSCGPDTLDNYKIDISSKPTFTLTLVPLK